VEGDLHGAGAFRTLFVTFPPSSPCQGPMERQAEAWEPDKRRDRHDFGGGEDEARGQERLRE
jgi:hypothetical protein